MSRPPVSDHAVCRYLERVEGVDIEKIRRRILPRELQRFVRGLRMRATVPVTGADGEKFFILVEPGLGVVSVVKKKRDWASKRPQIKGVFK